MTTDPPRLLLFLPSRPKLPPYINAQTEQQISCLRLYFDVKMVVGSCDFDRECSSFEPDIAVFESGVYARERDYANIRSHPHLLRLGFFNADAYCTTRTVFLSDMERWGISDYFTISVSMAEYFPSVADKMFVWPNFIDSQLYEGIVEEKSVAVLFTGSEAPHYPWRRRVHDIVERALPTLTVPRSSWWTQSAQMPQGEDYVRLLAGAWFAPACGTICKEVVRKHFEIPAAGTCLVAERSAGLEEAGFVDMVNCVFADTRDVVEKLNYLLHRKNELTGVIEAGRSLVLGRHTMAHRSQVLQWYQLRASMPRDGRIVQDGPFGDLRMVRQESNDHSRHVISGGIDRDLLRKAEVALQRGLVSEAEALFRRCLNYHFMPEAVLGLARCALKNGLPQEAEQWLRQSLDLVLGTYEAARPDPIEWAYLARTALCRGELELAVEIAGTYPTLRHPELDRMRAVLGTTSEVPTTTDRKGGHPTVHQLQSPPTDVWVRDLANDLRRCGQPSLSQTVEKALTSGSLPRLSHQASPRESTRRRRWRRISTARLVPRGRVAAQVLKRELESFARWVKRGRPKPAPFLEALAKLASRTEVRAVLLLGADPKGRLVSVLTQASLINCAGPLTLVSVPQGAAPADDPSRGAARNDDWVPSMVVVAEHGDPGLDWFALHRPEFVVIAAADQAAGSRLFHMLRDQAGYELLASGHDGSDFAVFQRPLSDDIAPRLSVKADAQQSPA